MRTVLHAARRLTAGAVTLLALALFMMSSPWLVRAQTTDDRPGSLAGTAARVQVSLAPGAAARGELRFTYDGAAPANAHATVLDHRLGPDGPVSQPPRRTRPLARRTGSPSRRPAWSSSQAPPRRSATASRCRLTPRPATTTPRSWSRPIRPAPAPVFAWSSTCQASRAARLTLVSFAAQPEPLHFLSYSIAAHLPVYDGGPIQLQAQAENDGNFIASVTGTVEMIDQFGRGVGRVELTPDQVLPGDVGVFSATWPNPPPFGYFAARLRLEADGTPLEAETRLLVVPWQQVVAALLVLVALRLLLGERFTLPVPGGAGRHGRPSSAAQAPTAPAANGQVVSTGDARGNQVVEPPAQPQEVGVGLQNGTHAEQDPAELLLWGQRAARAGDRPVAYRLFIQVLDVEPAQ